MQNINDVFNFIPMHVLTFSYGCPLPKIPATKSITKYKKSEI